jgi:hypothetical protein
MQQRDPDAFANSEIDNYQKIDLGSAVGAAKAASHKLNMDSERAGSKMTRTTAASANMTRMAQIRAGNRSQMPKSNK